MDLLGGADVCGMTGLWSIVRTGAVGKAMQICQTTAELGRNRAKFGRIRGRIGRHRLPMAELARNRPTLVDLAPNLVEITRF